MISRCLVKIEIYNNELTVSSKIEIYNNVLTVSIKNRNLL